MTVLSDTTLRQLILRNELILGGNPAFARNCAYDFKAARVVYGGTHPPLNQVMSIDLSADPSRTASILPSAVVWVRSREEVVIPANMVGIWTQTNSLSRKGLLLLNSTLVEPGYRGHLSAHFVNLGATPALLNADTTIAKLVFLLLDANATELVDSVPYRQYDFLIDDLAAKSNASFLRIADIAPDLKHAAATSVEDAKTRIAAILDDAVKSAHDRFLKLEKKTLYRVGSGFAVGFCLAVAFAVWIYPILRTADNESKDRIEATVREQNAILTDRLQRLQTDFDSLRPNGRSGSESSPPVPAQPSK